MINLVDARLLKGHLSYAVMPYFPDSTRAASGEILLPHPSYMHISRSKFTLQKSLLEDGNGAAAAALSVRLSAVPLAQFWGPIQVLPKWATFREKRPTLGWLLCPKIDCERWKAKERSFCNHVKRGFHGLKQATDTPCRFWNTFLLLSEWRFNYQTGTPQNYEAERNCSFYLKQVHL